MYDGVLTVAQRIDIRDSRVADEELRLVFGAEAFKAAKVVQKYRW